MRTERLLQCVDEIEKWLSNVDVMLAYGLEEANGAAVIKLLGLAAAIVDGEEIKNVDMALEIQKAVTVLSGSIRSLDGVENYNVSVLGKVSEHCAELRELLGVRTHVDKKENPDVRAAVFKLTDGRCAYCDVELVDGGQQSNSFVVEHVVPASCGGPDHLVNYVPSCVACNIGKRDGHVLDFIRRRTSGVVVPIKSASIGEAS